MQAHRFIELLKQPELLNDEILQELGEILEDFPYFQAAHLLYTLNLKKVKDSRFYSSLRKTACYMGDRKMLFYHVERDFFPFVEKLQGEHQRLSESSFELIDFFLSHQANSQNPLSESETSVELLSTDYLSYSLKEETQKKEENQEIVQPLKHQDAIDRFLEEDEKAPIKIDLKGPEEVNEEVFPNLDTVDENSFFSETLAKIYLKQKKYEKALEIIRKLNLIYPEKNRYFADQIRFLEKLIINTKK
ncbi:MAG: hypothetical protein LIO93_09660 [Bacteroidales bacterium]|nr:hypothetical protein [Bacteroidales bacterium]